MASGLPLAEFSSVALADIVSYLRSAGWRESGTYSRSVVWTLTLDQGDMEILVPADENLRDYASGVADIAKALAAVENRPAAEIVRDLRSTRVDVQYIRTIPDGPSGTIPLSEGLRAIKGTHDMMLVAATATVYEERPSLLPSTKPNAAKAFVDKLRLGQTSVGSYILRVESPLPDVGTTPPVSSRDVLLLLHQAVTAARQAAALTPPTDKDYGEFVERIGDGVSANLCDALVEIGGQRQNTFELRSAWAPGLPVEVETPAVRFDQPLIATVKRAGKFLRQLPVSTTATVTGRVIDLHRTPTDKLGKVQLAGILDSGGERSDQDRIVMRFTESDYELALSAHGGGHSLRVTGQLRHTGRQYEISRVDRVEVLSASDQ